MKVVKILIPIIFLILSVFIMEGGRFFKNLGEGKKVNEIIESIKLDLEKENFTDAKNKIFELKRIFNYKTKIIQFSVERDEIYEFTISLVKLENYIENKERNDAITEIDVLKEYWNELGK